MSFPVVKRILGSGVSSSYNTPLPNFAEAHAALGHRALCLAEVLRTAHMVKSAMDAPPVTRYFSGACARMNRPSCSDPYWTVRVALPDCSNEPAVPVMLMV